MNIILSGDLDAIEFESYRNIMKVFVSAGHTAYIWFRNQKNAFDLWDEFKPSLYIGREFGEKEEKLCKEYDTKYVRSIPLLCADVFQFGKKYEQTDLDKEYFDCDYCSIINHNEKEIINLKDFLNKEYSYKLFSQFRYTQTEYCGAIPQELYVAALSCTKTVLATNFLNLYNFTLVNPNTIYPMYSLTETYPRDRILDEHTCFSGARDLIKDNDIQIDMDVDAMYEKFRNENEI